MSRRPPSLSRLLARRRALAVIGTALEYLLRLAAFGIPLLLLYGAADAWMALPSDSRRVWNLLLPALLAAGALTGLRRPGSLAAVARRLDRRARDPRRTLSGALDLETREAPDEPLHRQLRESAVSEARDRLSRMPLRDEFPVRRLTRLAILYFLGALALLLIARRVPEPAWTVANRLLHPGRDLAPWTPLEFHITPETPSVVYGEDLQVLLRITGGAPRHPVVLRTRVRGGTREVPAFRESETRFSQRLEQMTEPVEFCFATGRIRSEWRRVEVEMLPRAAEAILTLTPPEYSGRPTRKLVFGERVIKGFLDTRIELSVRSNRPLASGSLVLDGGEGAPRTVEAEISGSSATFSWTLDTTADLAVQIRDLQGRAMAAPLRGHQRLVRDADPRVTLSDPPRFLLVTPGIRIPVKGYAEDDVGVTRVNLVRGMTGFIDRPKSLGIGSPDARVRVEDELDLAALGVEPGDTLELYLEAFDHRPDGGGRAGVSALSSIRVISEEDYAAQLRREERMNGFRERFRAASDALRGMRDSLQALQEEVDAERPTRESLRSAAQRAAAAHRRAAEVFRQLAEDFPAYEIERSAAAELAVLREHCDTQASRLEALDPDDMLFDRKVADITGAHRERTDQLAPTLAEQERFLALGSLLEQTAAYRELVKRQELLVRGFERTAYSLPGEAREYLEQLGAYQEALREELEAWIRGTEQRAGALSSGDAAWGEGAREVLRRLEQSDAASGMRRAAEAARNEANREALREARAVLEALQLPDPPVGPVPREAVSEPDDRFLTMCRGQALSGGEGLCDNPGISNSLRQLLNALRSGPGRGGSLGAGGGGIGGYSDDGYAAPGSSPLHVPLRGPNRNRFDLPRGQAVEGGNGRGGADGSGGSGIASGGSGGRGDVRTAPAELILEQAPPRYREAIRVYYDLETEEPP